MAEQRDIHTPEHQRANVGKLEPGSAQPSPGFEPGAAPPEATNRSHPTAPGTTVSAPGAGVVRAGADVTTIGGPDQLGDRPHPGQATTGGASGSAPGTRPLGGPGAGRSSTGTVPEAPSAASHAPLSADTAGEPGPADSEPVPAMVFNPNYTAANREGETPDRGGSDRTIRHEPDFFRYTRPGQRAPERVADVMTATVECCTPETELYYVARMMADRDVGAIPVVQSTEEMKPVLGILTDRDIVVRVLAKRQDPNDLRARDCMTSDVLTVTPDTSLADCLRRMEERQVRRVVVVDDQGRCTGIVAQADLARSLPQQAAGELVKDVSQPTQPGAEPKYH